MAASAPAVLAGVAMTATWRTRSLASLVVDLPAEFWLIKAAKGFVANLASRAQVVQRFTLGSDRAQPQLVIFGRRLRS